MLDFDVYVDAVQASSHSMSSAARRAGVGSLVPSCPGWTVRDLLAHTSDVHRWATGYLTQGYTAPVPRPAEAEILAAAPSGDAIFDWFDEGSSTLVAALREAPANLVAWTFMHAPSARLFWARRQAHETTIHRVDAEQASGVKLSSIGAEFALDGIEELLSGFLAHSRRAASGEVTARLVLVATDAEERWTITVHDHGAVVEPGARRRGAVVVAAPIEKLYLLCWNRLDLAELGGHDLDEPLGELARATRVGRG